VLVPEVSYFRWQGSVLALAFRLAVFEGDEEKALRLRQLRRQWNLRQMDGAATRRSVLRLVRL